MRPNGTRDLIHDHEWMPESVEAIWDGDVFVTWSCGWVEITGSVTSEQYDETFYETGAECCATKTAVYNVDIRKGSSDGESEDESVVWEHLWAYHQDAVEEAVECADPYDPMKGTSIDPLGPNHVVVLELEKTYVEEDWC